METLSRPKIHHRRPRLLVLLGKTVLAASVDVLLPALGPPCRATARISPARRRRRAVRRALVETPRRNAPATARPRVFRHYAFPCARLRQHLPVPLLLRRRPLSIRRRHRPLRLRRRRDHIALSKGSKSRARSDKPYGRSSPSPPRSGGEGRGEVAVRVQGNTILAHRRRPDRARRAHLAPNRHLSQSRNPLARHHRAQPRLLGRPR